MKIRKSGVIQVIERERTIQITTTFLGLLLLLFSTTTIQSEYYKKNIKRQRKNVLKNAHFPSKYHAPESAHLGTK